MAKPKQKDPNALHEQSQWVKTLLVDKPHISMAKFFVSVGRGKNFVQTAIKKSLKQDLKTDVRGYLIGFFNDGNIQDQATLQNVLGILQQSHPRLSRFQEARRMISQQVLFLEYGQCCDDIYITKKYRRFPRMFRHKLLAVHKPEPSTVCNFYPLKAHKKNMLYLGSDSFS